VHTSDQTFESMLNIDHLQAGYGPLTVLRDINLEVTAGEIVAIIGANGAGKSTLLNAVSGLLPASRGIISFNGINITRYAPHRIVKLGVCQVPESRQLFSHLTVMDNLELGAFSWVRGGIRGLTELQRVFDLFPRLRERAGQLAGTLSGGEQQMLALGRALMSRPKLLLLDEPSLGLAPMMVSTIFDVIAQLRRTELAIILVEQNARAALAMADRGYILETGRILGEGTGEALLEDEQVRRSYLGRD
jgi:branched-chain amino acid transport system ATP-binding protein